jgi:hypothetical protein
MSRNIIFVLMYYCYNFFILLIGGSSFQITTPTPPIDRYPCRKGGTAVAVRNRHTQQPYGLTPLVSIEAIGICIPTRSSEMLLGALYKSPRRVWIDADITELLGFKHKTIGRRSEC